MTDLSAFLLGVFATLCAQAILLYRFVLEPLLFAPPKKIIETPVVEETLKSAFNPPYAKWPTGITDFLKNALSATKDAPTGNWNDVHWLNVLIHRYFVECRESETLRVRLRRKLLDKLSKRFRADSPASLVVRVFYN
jgi:hypothetical protein